MDIQKVHFPSVFKISPDAEINLVGLDKQRGNVFPDELLYLAIMAKTIQAKNVFEIGTYDGRTTLNLAKNVTDDGMVYTLDLPPTKGDPFGATKFPIHEGEKQFFINDNIGHRFKEEGNNLHKITQLYGDSATFDFSPYFGKMDMVFLDGSHTKNYLISDTENAFKMLTDKGIVVWHDYGNEYYGIQFDDVGKFIAEYAKHNNTYNFYYIYFTLMVVARKKE